MGLEQLMEQLGKVIVPGWQTGVLLVIAYIVTDILRRRDAKEAAKEKAGEPQGEHHAAADSELFQRMLKELSDAKRRESDCSSEIASVKDLNRSLTQRVDALEQLLREKDAQITTLFKLMRHRAQPGGSTETDESLEDMRAWMIAAFNEDDLEIIAADAKLTRPGHGSTPEKISQALIDEAKRRGILPELEEIILAKRPNVKPW